MRLWGLGSWNNVPGNCRPACCRRLVVDPRVAFLRSKGRPKQGREGVLGTEWAGLLVQEFQRWGSLSMQNQVHYFLGDHIGSCLFIYLSIYLVISLLILAELVWDLWWSFLQCFIWLVDFVSSISVWFLSGTPMSMLITPFISCIDFHISFRCLRSLAIHLGVHFLHWILWANFLNSLWLLWPVDINNCTVTRPCKLLVHWGFSLVYPSARWRKPT